ncbi:MAG: response regulator [Acidobacteria bacterium]|nr:response regulator [Acidobacteriota bacterium]
MGTASDALHPVVQRSRLLIVDDELGTVLALRSFFTLADYDVDCALRSEEGLQLLDLHQYDAVITDLHLSPGRIGEGLRIAEHARLRSPVACVVMLTAYGSEATQEEAVRRGVDIYQTKPVELPRLMRHIERVVNGHARRG